MHKNNKMIKRTKLIIKRKLKFVDTNFFLFGKYEII